MVGIYGPEGAVGIVIDFDNFMDSGVFVSTGPAAGANAGWAVGFGAARRELEGWSYNVDANLGAVSPTVSFDDAGFNGGSLAVGPGIGGSVSATHTSTYTVSDLINDIKSIYINGGEGCQ